MFSFSQAAGALEINGLLVYEKGIMGAKQVFLNLYIATTSSPVSCCESASSLCQFCGYSKGEIVTRTLHPNFLPSIFSRTIQVTW